MKILVNYHFYDFNVYSALLLCPFITGLLFVVLCFGRFKRQSELPMLFLSCLLFLLVVRLSFWMLGFAGWYDRRDAFTTFMFYFPFNTFLIIGPCLYLYFLSITNRNFRLTKSLWPHFILPSILIFLYIFKFAIDFMVYRPFPCTERFQFGTRGPLAELDKSQIVYLVSYLSLAYYFILILKKLKGFKKYLLINFADTEGIDLYWLKRLIWFTVAAMLLFFCFYLLNLLIKVDYAFNWYPYLILGMLIYYISINGYYHSGGLFRTLHFSASEASTTIGAAESSDHEPWKQNLAVLMEKERPYLDPAINLSSLASRLGINSSVLSRVINEGLAQNFNDYINGLRVAAVLRQIEKEAHKKYSIMGIAWDCGFNSKTTFNRSFKKITGKTPTEYIKTLQSLNDNSGCRLS